MKKNVQYDKKTRKQEIVVSIFVTKEQENLFSKRAQQSMLNNAISAKKV